MNLKSSVTIPKTSKHYIPHKLRSHPLRCIIFPLLVLFLFILFWFIMCPLIFVGLLKERNNWPKEWPYYYWTVALIVFVILLSILVCLWRCGKKEDSRKTESDLLLNSSPLKTKASKHKDLYVVSLNTIQRSQDKLEMPPLENVEKQQNCSVNITKLEEKLTEENPESETERRFSKCSIHHGPQKDRKRPSSLAIPIARETKAEIHSASSPLTPRELFFWDLIRSANRSQSSVTNNFIELEKKHYSLDSAVSLSSPRSPKSNDEGVQIRVPRSDQLSSTEYFIASIPDRKSLTAEIFLYVDGGQKEKCLKIRTTGDGDDDVFKN